MTLLEEVISLGGIVVRSVDMQTGEVTAPLTHGTPGASRALAREVGGRAEAREVLSTCHNSPQIILLSGASLLTVKRKKREKREKREKTGQTERKASKRGKVGGFSAKSRQRLMRTVSAVRRDCLPVFVTLTYPFEYPERSDVFKRHLDNFLKRLARKFPEVAGVWKLEPQKRGAPHYHLLIWGASLEELREFIPLAWYQVVGSGEKYHLEWHQGGLGNQPCVQQVESQRGVFWYVNKYMSKKVSADCANWGRWWGVFFRERLPLGELVNVEVSERKAIEFIRYMRRFAGVKSRDYRSLTIICNPDVWLNRIL